MYDKGDGPCVKGPGDGIVVDGRGSVGGRESKEPLREDRGRGVALV